MHILGSFTLKYVPSHAAHTIDRQEEITPAEALCVCVCVGVCVYRELYVCVCVCHAFCVYVCDAHFMCVSRRSLYNLVMRVCVCVCLYRS